MGKPKGQKVGFTQLSQANDFPKSTRSRICRSLDTSVSGLQSVWGIAEDPLDTEGWKLPSEAIR